MVSTEDYSPGYGLNLQETDSREKPLSGTKKAVALQYDTSRDSAPRITASGQGAIAEQILNLAFAHGIKVKEDAALVDILGMLDIDTLIPLEAYAAVAEILTYVYRANAVEARMSARSDPRQPDAVFETDNPHA